MGAKTRLLCAVLTGALAVCPGVLAQDGSGAPLVPDADAAAGSGSAAGSSAQAGSGAPAPTAQTEVAVRVTRLDAAMVPMPVADTEVRLHLVLPPHDVVDTRRASTGADGVARFVVPALADGQVHAEVQDGTSRFSAPTPIGSGTPQTIEMQLLATTADPSVVFVARLITVVQPSEDYVIVQQVYTFGLDQPVVWRPDLSNPGPGMAQRMLRVALPEGAAGVEVVRPADQVRHLGDNLYYGAEIAPPGEGEQQGPHLVVQYSLRTHNAREFLFEQALSLDVESVSFVVPRTSEYERHPVLDLQLEVPLCETPVTGEVCFEQITNDTSGMAIDPTAQVLVARNGRGSAGDTLRVHTAGWPSRPPWHRVIGGILGGFALLGGLWFVRAELAAHRARSGDQTVVRIAALRVQRDRILAEVAATETAYAARELTTRDYSARIELLSEQLAAVLRALRELETPAVPAAEGL